MITVDFPLWHIKLLKKTICEPDTLTRGNWRSVAYDYATMLKNVSITSNEWFRIMISTLIPRRSVYSDKLQSIGIKEIWLVVTQP